MTIPVADLLFDEQNPRLASPNVGQREAMRALATVQGSKMRVLAEDILTYGLDPSELTIVESIAGIENRFVVLDGNRRLAALRALENPDSIADAVPPSVLNAMRRLSKSYQDAPIEAIQCLVFRDRDEARHWIELRHMGERGGAGSVLWGSDESARFRARAGELPDAHTQALDFLQRRGDITQDDRSKIATTTYRRLLGSPAVRAKLGVEWSDRSLKALADEDEVARALLYVANDIGKWEDQSQRRVHECTTNLLRQ